MRQYANPRPNVVESDDGFSFEVVGRSSIRYVEAGRAAVIASEILAVDAIGVWDQKMRWEPPHDAEWMDAATRHLILGRMVEAFAAVGWPLQVSS